MRRRRSELGPVLIEDEAVGDILKVDNDRAMRGRFRRPLGWSGG
jgi:hypothetical protein